MTNLIHATGKLIVAPESRKQSKKRANGDWAIVPVDVGLAEFYREMLITNLLHPKWLRESRKVHGTFWKPHITVLDGRKPLTDKQKELLAGYNGVTIKYQYDVSPYNVWKFWALRVYSEDLDKIRKNIGLPRYPFHITIAREE